MLHVANFNKNILVKVDNTIHILFLLARLKIGPSRSPISGALGRQMRPKKNMIFFLAGHLIKRVYRRKK
jgi:hypothetical protein